MLIIEVSTPSDRLWIGVPSRADSIIFFRAFLAFVVSKALSGHWCHTLANAQHSQPVPPDEYMKVRVGDDVGLVEEVKRFAGRVVLGGSCSAWWRTIRGGRELVRYVT
jgi:hypothetical protein